MSLPRDWRLKALAQAVLSVAPGSGALHYWLQRHLTGGLPVDREEFLVRLDQSRLFLDLFERHAGRPRGRAVFYEFGAGWDLLRPLCYWALGVERQILVDIELLVRDELVRDSLEKLRRAAEDREDLRAPPPPPAEPADLLPWLEETCGVEYRAPADARSTGLAGGSVDCVTSVNTLEHIPPADIAPILRECRRILRPTGVFVGRIDYQDHYAYFDGDLSPYNFLRYSDRAWRFLNPSAHYQNRLRHSEHLALLRDAGFELLEVLPEGGHRSDVEEIRALPLAERFRGLEPEDVAVRAAVLAARPAATHASRSGAG